MQLIADQLPETTRVQDIPNEPNGCENDSVLYIGHWVLFQPTGFDAEAFIDSLPEQLGEEFVERDLGIESSRPNVHFIATAHGETQVCVATGETDGEPWVDITALSRCDGAGVLYTGRWEAHPGPNFDGEAFIAALPEELGSDWVVSEDEIPLSKPNVVFEVNDVVVDIRVTEDGNGEPLVGVLGLSVCGADPPA